MIWAKIGYEHTEKIRALEPEQWSRFRELWPGARTTTDPKNFWGGDEVRVTVDEARAIEEEFGITIEVRAWGGTQLTKMQDVPNPVGWERPSPADLLEGRVVQIAIAELGLLHIRSVMVMEDACTDALQDKLDEGWRILAVCPPNAARRPDYILGRSDKSD